MILKKRGLYGVGQKRWGTKNGERNHVILPKSAFPKEHTHERVRSSGELFGMSLEKVAGAGAGQLVGNYECDG